MGTLILKVGSVTYALKAKDILRSRGIKCGIRKTPDPRPGEGCGYSVLIPGGTKAEADALRLAGIGISRMLWEP